MLEPLRELDHSQLDQSAVRCQCVRHPHIVWFAREPVDELLVANNRHQPGRRVGQGQGTVVETSAAPEPDPLAIHRKRRHQNHDRGCDRVGSKPPTAWLAQPEPRFDEAVGPVLAPLQGLGDARGVMAGDRQ